MGKQARQSFGKPWDCLKPWPADCFVQCGGDGIVLPAGGLKAALTESAAGLKVIGEMAGKVPMREGAYRTAFFEAFPKNPSTFIRGEGATIEEAEASAWRQFEKFRACAKHQFHRKGYRNGAGFCRKCGMFKSKVFRVLDRCKYNCGRPGYDHDKNGKWYCRKHNHKNPNRMFDRIDGKLVMRTAEERA